MMQLVKRSTKTVAALALCFAAAGTVARPVAVQAQPTLAIGVVDEDKLGDNYTKYKSAVAKLDQQVQDLDQQLEGRKLLSDEEGGNFDALIMKDNRSAADETQLQALIKTGLDRQAEFIRLSGSATRSDADNARVKELQALGAANLPKYQEISDKIFAKLKQQQDSTDQQYTDAAKNIIAQVAKDKNLAIVVRLRAVVWSAPTIDITDEVLARLNKS